MKNEDIESIWNFQFNLVDMMTDPFYVTVVQSDRNNMSFLFISPLPSQPLFLKVNLHGKFHLVSKGSLQKVHPFFFDKCHKPGGGSRESFVTKNYHISKSFSSHLELFQRFFFFQGGGLQLQPQPRGFTVVSFSESLFG